MRNRPLLLAAALGLTSLLPGYSLAQDRSTASRTWALVGGAVYISPTEPPIHDGVVLIQGGTIAAVGRRKSIALPRGIDVLDCSGMTITAGFWNSHVHFFERKWADAATIPASDLTRQLQRMLTQYGFTNVFDTWSMWENTKRIRDRIESGEIAAPRIRSTGEAIFGKASSSATSPPAAAWSALGFMPLEAFQIARVEDGPEALAASKRLLDAGTDGTKLYAMTPGRNSVPLSESAIQAAVKEAHGRGKPVFAHPSSVTGLLASVRGGVDVLAHTTPQSGPWDESALGEMRRAGVALIPTLKFWRYELRHDRISVEDRFVDTGVGQLRAWMGAGGSVLFGTDVGYMTDYDTTEEYELMGKAGMDFRQILASLTTAPAERFGESSRLGRIAAGLAADLVVLGEDPSREATAFAAVRYTIRSGRVIYDATATPPTEVHR